MKNFGNRLMQSVEVSALISAVVFGCASGGGASSANSNSTIPSTIASTMPTSSNSDTRASAGNSLSDAVEAIEAGEFERAKAILDKVLVARSTSPQAHYYQGVVLQNLGSSTGAVVEYRKALQLQPEFVEASLNLAAVLLDEGKAGEALPVIEDSLKLQPKDPALLYNRAMALASLGPIPETVAAFRLASAAAPKDLAIRYEYAASLLKAGQRDAARTILLQLVEAQDVAILASTARLLGRLKEFSGCILALDKAMAQQPAAELFVTRGLCQHGQGRDDAALLDFQKAQKEDPNFAAAHYYIGMHWKHSGDKAAARVSLERTVALAGSAGVGKAAARALQSL